MKALFIFILTAAVAPHAAASFRGGYKSPQDLIISARRALGKIAATECQIVRSGGALGDNNLQTGEPSSELPGNALINAIDTCVSQSTERLVSDDFLKKAFRESVEDLFAPVISSIPGWESRTDEERRQAFLSARFADLPDRQLLIGAWVERVLGPDEVILEYGLMKNPDRFRADLQTYLESSADQSLKAAIRRAFAVLMKRDEFLLY